MLLWEPVAMLRVLILTYEFTPYLVGGVGSHVSELVPALAQRGIEVHVVTPRWNGGEHYEILPGGARIYRVSAPSMRNDEDIVSQVRQANRQLAEVGGQIIQEHRNKFDIIHAHDWLVAESAMELKLTYKIPLVATIHATERGRGRGHLWSDTQWAINSIEQRLTYEAWRVICCSHYMYHEVQNYFGVPENKIDVIPNAVEASNFMPQGTEDLQTFRAKYALPQERIVYFVGRLVHEKGSHLLVEAAPLVLQEISNAKFVISGKGPMLEFLLSRTVSLGVPNKIFFTNYVSDEIRNHLYNVADAAVFPSLYEPFGIVALEAMAAQVPLVVSSVGGLAEVVEHNDTGITVYPDNPESLAWGIIHTLRYPEWAHQRTDNAYRKLRSDYSWERVARLTTAVYDRVSGERVISGW
ncbi:MAG: glycosyltransferase family 1 protein [Chloroflexi bacterium]|nr:glycosyltransferase family 1 protein [Chloroflexota bacterium]